MHPRRLPRAITVGRVLAIDITLNWRWLPVLILVTWLLGQNVVPARFPLWNFGTIWVTSAAAVLAGELGLLLHELSHALAARGRGQEVVRIVFHGLRAETVLGERIQAPDHELVIALAGPATNLVLAGVTLAVRTALAAEGPLDVLLLTVALSNAAMVVMSLVPLPGSDGWRVFSALTRARRARQRERTAQA